MREFGSQAKINFPENGTRKMAKVELKPWPRLWHNLRASCETDLVQRYPLPVVAKWLGNTSVIAMRHYVDVTDEVFRQAAQRGTESGTLLAHFAAQSGEATQCNDVKNAT